MTAAALPWLPPGATLPQPAHVALADMVDGWSREWFAARPLAAGRLRRVPDGHRPVRGAERHECAPGVAIGCSADAPMLLGARAAAVSAQAAGRPPADAALLARVGSECLDDLRRRARALLCPDDSPPGHAAHCLEIGSPARDLPLTLELSEARFAAFLKSWLPRPGSRRQPHALGGAVAALEVPVSAALGSCVLTAGELATLGIGDVLVLDSDLEAEVPLTVAGKRVRRGAGTISSREGALVLAITQAIEE